MTTQHLQVQQLDEATDDLARQFLGPTVRMELDLELMLLQLRVMHHLLEAMRPLRSARPASASAAARPAAQAVPEAAR